jgi:rhamnosyltransferase
MNSNDVVATVAILTKNPGSIFKDVLRQVLAQKTAWRYEVLVIDSGSLDGTIEFIQDHVSVRLIQIASSEFGHGKTRNLAMSLAQGKYVAMLTHDAKPFDSDWLSNIVAVMESDCAIGGVFGRHVAYPEATPYIKRDLKLHFDHFLQWPTAMGIEDSARYERDQGYRQVLHYFSDNNACLKKSVWEILPYPDVDFAEDQLWAKSLVEAGYKRAYADRAVVFHSHDYSIWDTFRRSFDESRAMKRLFGYELCPSFSHALYQIFACTRRDVVYLMRSEKINNYLGLALKTPLLHLAKQFGFLIGIRQGAFKGYLFRLFSLDNSKKVRG